MAGFGHGSGFAVAPNRVVTNAHVVAMAADDSKTVAIGVVPSEGAQATRARIIAIDPARDLALLEIEEGSLTPIPLYHRPARRRRAGRGLGLSRQCRSRHRALGRRLYHAAAADPLGRHLLQRAADQRHHHPAPHRQHRPRPFGRAAARPVRPGARRQHLDHPQPGRRRALRLRRRQSRAHRLPPPGAPALPGGRPPNASAWPTGCARTRSAPPAEERARPAAAAPRPRRRATRASAASPRSRRAARTGSPSPSCCSSSPCSPSAAPASCWSRTGRSRRSPSPAAAPSCCCSRSSSSSSRPSLRRRPRRRAEGAGGARGGARAASPAATSAAWCPSAAGSPSPRPTDVPLDWSETGCVNAPHPICAQRRGLDPDPRPRRRAGGVGARIPPGERRICRHPLSARRRRRWAGCARCAATSSIKACTADPEARTILADQQREIGAVLPRLPNERLVYACENQGPAAAAAPAR